MSVNSPMNVNSIYRWHERALSPLEYCDMTAALVEAADSWLVTDGKALALSLHRERFLRSIGPQWAGVIDPEAFWDAAIALVPREGDWFPRVELQSRGGSPLLVFRLRSAPERTRSVIVAQYKGLEKAIAPTVKGPDLEKMQRIRTAAQASGAGEAVLLTPDGFVVEGAYSGLLWWRGEILCAPLAEFARIDSVTVRSVLTLAVALGVEVHEEAVTPAELDGVELWALNALHGIRIVTRWVDGPALAELPGRLGAWRARLEALRQPL